MSYCIVYCTFDTLENAQNLSKKLLESKLIACANILPQMNSMYIWKENLTTEKEHIALFKTKENLFTQVQEEILCLHSYDCPCIIKLNIDDVNLVYKEFLDSMFSEA